MNDSQADKDLSDALLKQKEQELGVIGKYFGSRSNAALYIAAMVVVLCIISISIIAAYAPDHRGDLVKILGAVCVGALGYIGGLMSGD